MFQFMPSYKTSWAGLPVRFVNPVYSSKICPVCSALLRTYRGRVVRCEGCGPAIDHDEAAASTFRCGVLGFPERGVSTEMMPKGGVCL